MAHTRAHAIESDRLLPTSAAFGHPEGMAVEGAGMLDTWSGGEEA